MANEIYIGGKFKNIIDADGVVVDAAAVAFEEGKNLKVALTEAKEEINTAKSDISTVSESIKTLNERVDNVGERKPSEIVDLDFDEGIALTSGIYRVTDRNEENNSINNPEGSDEYGILVVDDFTTNSKTLIKQTWNCTDRFYIRYISEIENNAVKTATPWKLVKEIEEEKFSTKEELETYKAEVNTNLATLSQDVETLRNEKVILPELSILSVSLNDKIVDSQSALECNPGDKLKIIYSFESVGNEDISSTVTYTLGTMRGTVGMVLPNGITNYEWNYTIPEVESAVYTLSIFGTVYKMQSKKSTITLKIGALSIKSSFNENTILETGKAVQIPVNIDFADIGEYGITAHIFFDETELEIPAEDKNITQKGSHTFVIPSERVVAGVHNIKIYLKNKTTTEGPDSNVLEFVVVAAEPGKVYAIPNKNIYEASAGERLTLSVRTIQLKNEKSLYPAEILIYNNAKTEVVRSFNYTFNFGVNLIQINDLVFGENNNEEFDPNDKNSKKYTRYFAKFIVSSEDENAIPAEVEFEIKIFENNYNINPVLDNLTCWFSASGKSNQSSDYAIWSDKSTNNVTTKLNNFNWSTNGWNEELGALEINSGAYVEIDLAPLFNEVGDANPILTKTIEDESGKVIETITDPELINIENGITVSIDFETENILNPEAKVLSCLYEYDGEDTSVFYLKDTLNEYIKAPNDSALGDTEEEYEPLADGTTLYLSNNNVLNYFRYAGGYCWVDGKIYPNEEWPSSYLGLRKSNGDLPYETTVSSNASDRAINYNLGDIDLSYNNPSDRKPEGYNEYNPDKANQFKKFTGINKEKVTKQVGFYVDTENAVLSNTASPAKIEDKFHLNFSEKTRTKIDLIITRSTEAPYYFKSMIGYVNGCLSLMKQINDSDAFQQNPNSGKKYKIYLGGKMSGNEISDIGSCKIYDFKIYNRALTPDEVLTNYAAGISDLEEKIKIIDNNGILNKNSIAKMPQITFIGAMVNNTSTINKFIMQLSDKTGMEVSDLKKIKEPAYMQFSDPSTGTEWKVSDGGSSIIPIRLQFQGTSSMVYPIKNFKFKCYSTDFTTKSDGSIKYGKSKKFNLGNGIEEGTFCLKVDFMDSSHCNNTGSANFISDYNIYATGTTPASEIDNRIRTTIYGFPVLIYYKETVNDEVPKFIGVGNLNLDKSCTTSFGLKDKVKDPEGVSHDFGKAYFIDDEETKDILIKSLYKGNIEGLVKEESPTFKMVDNWQVVYGTKCYLEDNFVAVEYNSKYYTVQETLIFDEDEEECLTGGPYEIALENPNSGNIVATLTERNTLRSLDGSEISNVSCSEYKANSGKDGAGGFGNYSIESVAKDIELRQPDDGDLEEINYGDAKELAGYLKIVGKENAISYKEFKIPYYYHIQRMIKWVSKNSPHNAISKAGFINELDGHFNRNYLMDYYLTISLLGGVDSLGKNLMVGTWGPENKLYITDEAVKSLPETDPEYDPLAFEYNGKWLTPKVVKIKTGVDDEGKDEYKYKYATSEDGLQLFYDESCFDRWTNSFKSGHSEFIVTTKPAEVIWYPIFYDIDTICGLDNSGQLIYDVDIEIGDKLVDGTAVFNTDDSHLWLSVKKYLGEEDESGNSYLSERWNLLRDIRRSENAVAGDTLFSATNLVGRFYNERQISRIPITYYNQDCFIKYIYEGPTAMFDESGKFTGSGSYLYCIHGSRYEQIKRWYSQRIYYLDTLYNRGLGTTNASLRFNHDRCDQNFLDDPLYYSDLTGLAASKPDKYVYDPLTNKLTTPKGAEILPISFNFKTYQPGYVGIKWFNGGKIHRKRVRRGETTSIIGNVPTAGDAEVFIFGADNIKDIGEMYEYNVKQVDFRNLKKLSRLILGSENSSCVINKLDLGDNNTYLSELDLRGCSKLTTLSVNSCINLRTLRMDGSAITSVSLPSGGALESIYYSSSIDTIQLENFINLKLVSTPSLNNTTKIIIKNCPNITGYIDKDGKTIYNSTIWKMLQQTENANAINTIDVEAYGICEPFVSLGKTYFFLDKFCTLNTSKTIRGEISYIGTLIPENYTKFSKAYPKLNILYSNITDASEMFANYKNIDAIGSVEVQTGVDEYNRPIKTTVKYWKDEGTYIDGTSIKDEWYDKNGMPKENTGISTVYKPGETFFYIDSDGKYYRILEKYNDKDLDLVRKQIKDAVQNFTKFTNIKGMFRNLAILDYIDMDTFNNIDLSEVTVGGADEMFKGCTNLRYFEVPSDRVRSIIRYRYTNLETGVTHNNLEDFTQEEQNSGNIERVSYKYDPVNNVETDLDYITAVRGLRVLGKNMFEDCRKVRVLIRKLLNNNKIIIDSDCFKYNCFVRDAENQDRKVTIERPVILFEHLDTDLLTTTSEASYIKDDKEIFNRKISENLYFKINSFGEREFNFENNFISISDTTWLREVYFDVKEIVINEEDENFSLSYALCGDNKKIIFNAVPLSNLQDFNNKKEYNIKSLTCGALRNLKNISSITVPVPYYDNLDKNGGKIKIEYSLLSTLIEGMFLFETIQNNTPATLSRINIVDSDIIPERFLYGFSNVSILGFDDSLIEISSEAFAQMSSLKNIYYIDGHISYYDEEDYNKHNNEAPSNTCKLSRIYDRAFEQCSALKLFDMRSMNINTNYERGIFLGKSVFYNCINLTTIYFSKNLREIPDETFYNCTALNTLSDFSENINRFGQACFFNCYSLQLIKFKKDSESSVFDIIAFNTDTNNKKLGFSYFISDEIEICDSAFYNVGGLIRSKGTEENTIIRTKLTIPSSIKIIGNDAFSQSNVEFALLKEENITEIVWENVSNDESGFSNLKIGDRAFFNIRPAHTETINDKNELLESVLFLPEISEIGADAFHISDQTTPLSLCLVRNNKNKFVNSWINLTNKIIYGYTNVADIKTSAPNRGNSDLNGRYLLAKQDSQNIAYLFKTLTEGKGTLYIPATIEFENEQYTIKELLSNSLDVYGTINVLLFDTASSLSIIESHVLTSTSNLSSIALWDGTELDDNMIPEGLTIETGNKLKESQWFTLQNSETGDAKFIKLGRYLIGRLETEDEKENEYLLDLTDPSIESCDTIYDNAFEGANCNKVKFSEKIKYIYTSAFKNSKLSYITDDEILELPRKLEEIKSEAFVNCKFKKLFFPASLKKVDTGAFKQNSSGIGILEHIEFADGCALSGKDPFDLQMEMKLSIEPKSANITLKTLIIPASMSSYFSPAHLSRIRTFSQVTNLYLGNIERDENGYAKKIENVPLYIIKGENGESDTIVKNPVDGAIPYCNDDGDQYYSYAFYERLIENISGKEKMVLLTTERESYCPYGDIYSSENPELVIKNGYHDNSSIDISSIRNYRTISPSVIESEVEGSGNITLSEFTSEQLLALIAGFSDERKTLRLRQSQYAMIRNYINQVIIQCRQINFDIIAG